MRTIVTSLLSDLKIAPVLMDIGASAHPPRIWNAIAPQSVYVGFDPDLREIHEERSGGFLRSVIVDEAVISTSTRADATFYLTRWPFGSSTLEPDPGHVFNWLNSDQFDVERTASVRATTIDAALKRVQVTGVDWLKTDSQGTDLRLFNSIAPDVRARVLALDIEPGFIEVYKNEDLFVHVHDDLTRNGFWMAGVTIGGFIRMRRQTLEAARGMDPGLDEAFIKKAVRTSPAYAEARYLRTLEWLAQNGFGEREYALLWTFAVMDQQLGFALDVVFELEKIHGQSDLSRRLAASTSLLLRRAYRRRQVRKAAERVSRTLTRVARRIVNG
jgi:hypothetical protein